MSSRFAGLTQIALAAAALLAAAGCGGEESAACGDLENIQSSIQDADDIELEEGALEELQQTAADIESDLQSAQENADAELGDSSTRFGRPCRLSSPRPRRPQPQGSAAANPYRR